MMWMASIMRLRERSGGPQPQRRMTWLNRSIRRDAGSHQVEENAGACRVFSLNMRNGQAEARAQVLPRARAPAVCVCDPSRERVEEEVGGGVRSPTAQTAELRFARQVSIVIPPRAKPRCWVRCKISCTMCRSDADSRACVSRLTLMSRVLR